MADPRLLMWFFAILTFIIAFPIIRKFANTKNSSISSDYLKNLAITGLSTGSVFYLYEMNYIEAPEFQFLEILIIFLFLYSGFNSTNYNWSSIELRIVAFSKSILQQISRSYGGSKVEILHDDYNFNITTPYRLKYTVNTTIKSKDKLGKFSINSQSSNLNLIKVILLGSFYLISEAYITDQEDVDFPIIGFETSAVLAVLFAISTTLIILYFEIESAKSIIETLPSVYGKILQKEALNKASGGTDLKLKEIDVKSKAQTILDKRKSNLIKAKKEEVQGKLSSVFGEKETEGLDKQSIKRMRLMETVKRILNSTPPWSEVSLNEIANLADGDEQEIEIIIAGLRDLKEVAGIYDIWTKTYYGTSSSHWLITKLLNDLPETSTSLENVRIFPDGGGEFSFKKKEK